MANLQISIRKVKQLKNELNFIEKQMKTAGLENIDFLEDGKKVEINPENVKFYKFCGLNMIDFVLNDFYKNKIITYKDLDKQNK